MFSGTVSISSCRDSVLRLHYFTGSLFRTVADDLQLDVSLLLYGLMLQTRKLGVLRWTVKCKYHLFVTYLVFVLSIGATAYEFLPWTILSQSSWTTAFLALFVFFPKSSSTLSLHLFISILFCTHMPSFFFLWWRSSVSVYPNLIFVLFSLYYYSVLPHCQTHSYNFMFLFFYMMW